MLFDFLKRKNVQKGWVLLALVIVFLFVLLRTAWLCDDAYITLRVVDNFVSGYGPVWNISERVQVYTHPLWFLLLSSFVYITGEIYYTVLFVSIIITTTAYLIVIIKITPSIRAGIFGGVLLLLSHSFIDYATSGLENPLTFLLLALFFWVYLNQDFGKTPLLRLFAMALLSALGMLNRLDLALIFIPPLLYSLLKVRRAQTVIPVMIGFLPLAAWFLFSIFYYGFPFPNTAYAKLSTTFSTIELIATGIYYFIETFVFDPVTIVLGALLIWVAAQKSPKDEKRLLQAGLIGISLYAFYLIRIGGDFMVGRMLTPIIFTGTILVIRFQYKKMQKFWLLFTGIALAISLLATPLTILSDENYKVNISALDCVNLSKSLAGDERCFYYRTTGLWRKWVGGQLAVNAVQWENMGNNLKQSGKEISVTETIGIMGFFAGPDVHIVDQLALADAFLARLPPDPEQPKRVGHIRRIIPAGYIETLETGTNKIKNPRLSLYYEKLTLIIRGDLFDRQRWIEIWNLNSGKYDHLLQD
jgi:arabinofuranosyltransferase